MKGIAILLAFLPLAASAATITVNTAADNRRRHDGKCTLREAITNVNAAADTTMGECAAGSGAGDTIVFSLPLPATIRLSRGTLTITKDVTILGSGRSVLVIDGRKRFRVFEIASGTTAMSDLTIQNGRYKRPYSEARGGGILLDSGATLNLSNCDVLGNTAMTGARALNGANGGGIYIADNATATVTNSTISGNTASGSDARGGGILLGSGATLNLSNCDVLGNTATTGRFAENGGIGGGIYMAANATATVTNSTISGNTASSARKSLDSMVGARGGGIFIQSGGTATLTDSEINQNTAGGIFIDAGATAMLTGSTINGNTTDVAGSGIYNRGTLTLTNCTLDGNIAPYSDFLGAHYGYGDGGGSIYNDGTLSAENCVLKNNGGDSPGGGGLQNRGTATLKGCTFNDNIGGGIINRNFPDSVARASLVLINSTMRGNFGGGILNMGADATLIGCTLSGAPYGGGISSYAYFTNANLTVINCTISGNHSVEYNGIFPPAGGGIFTEHRDASLTHTTTVINTIVALNTPRDCAYFGLWWESPYFGNHLTSDDHNLDSDATCFTSANDLNADPLLAPLGNYGGPTQTMALCTGPGVPDSSCTGASPAIDAANDSVTGPPDNVTTDQRGMPRLSGAHVDIGAYEVQQ